MYLLLKHLPGLSFIKAWEIMQRERLLQLRRWIVLQLWKLYLLLTGSWCHWDLVHLTMRRHPYHSLPQPMFYRITLAKTITWYQSRWDRILSLLLRLLPRRWQNSRFSRASPRDLSNLSSRRGLEACSLWGYRSQRIRRILCLLLIKAHSF